MIVIAPRKKNRFPRLVAVPPRRRRVFSLYAHRPDGEYPARRNAIGQSHGASGHEPLNGNSRGGESFRDEGSRIHRRHYEKKKRGERKRDKVFAASCWGFKDGIFIPPSKESSRLTEVWSPLLMSPLILRATRA